MSLAIIHSGKLGLMAMFFVSVFKATVFNTLLFLMFLAFSMADFSQLKQYWNIPITVNSLIIMAIYGYEIFAPAGTRGLDPAIAKVIGFNNYSDENRLIKYVPYLFL